jgi:hypothetical protein
MAKLSDKTESSSGPVESDQFHYIRSNGDSPETFSSYRGTIGDIPVPYDLPLSFAGTPDAGALIGKLVTVRAIEFEADFAGSAGHVGVTPAATFDIDVQDDGVSIGTISISTGGIFSFTTDGGTAKSVAAGSRIEFYAPSDSPAEDTVADIAATLKGLY